MILGSSILISMHGMSQELKHIQHRLLENVTIPQVA